jgi:hypothetical protein
MRFLRPFTPASAARGHTLRRLAIALPALMMLTVLMMLTLLIILMPKRPCKARPLRR